MNDPRYVKSHEVTRIGDHTHISRSLAETTADAIERRVRRWVMRIPGASR